jgi:hypothetical protein
MALQRQVHNSFSDSKIADPQLLKKLWEHRVGKAHLAMKRSDFKADRGLQQQKDGPRRPRLRRTGDGIEGRTFAVALLETTEQFRQAMEIDPFEDSG